MSFYPPPPSPTNTPYQFVFGGVEGDHLPSNTIIGTLEFSTLKSKKKKYELVLSRAQIHLLFHYEI